MSVLSVLGERSQKGVCVQKGRNSLLMAPVFQTLLRIGLENLTQIEGYLQKNCYGVKSGYMESFFTVGTIYVKSEIPGEFCNVFFHGRDDNMYIIYTQILFIFYVRIHD